MQDASLGSTNKTTKRTIYAAVAFAGLIMWSYYSGIETVCMCVEGAVCDCTNYAIEAAEMTGVALTMLGIGMFVLSFIRGKPDMLSWV